ncbi:MAG: patatin-like phospholipase family protein [Ginsengibacter sp.]
MKTFIQNVYYSFPVQLLLLHFRKTQVLLIFWFILFLTITGNFLKIFGANALFLAPEYLGNVNAAGAAITGMATGVFIMSWNITTFILHSIRFRFLATNSKPFLKYCVNNSIIPACFLLIYFFEALSYDRKMELISIPEFVGIAAGFIGGFLLLIVFSFVYFFTADRRIVRTFKPDLTVFDKHKKFEKHEDAFTEKNFGLPVGYYLTTRFRFNKARKVGHYSQEFLDTIFKRHHFSAMITIVLAFIVMIFIGFFLDNKIFQVPAAASILMLFALLIAVIGALTYFLRSWSMLFVIFLFIVLNVLYVYDIIDPRNKAFGLDYTIPARPEYSLHALESMYTSEKVAADKSNMLGILKNWKQNQGEEKPVMVVFNFSGGGVRSAAFAMSVLQELDSMTHGTIMKKTVLISGASGGMLAAAYFRELARLKSNGADINLKNRKYVNDISKDLLNPIFSSMIARDLLSPAQKFSVGPYRYVKDRGYAFEQKLNENTHRLLDKNIGFYKNEESSAQIPLMILNSVITRDLRKLMVCTQPLSFMMQAAFSDSTSQMSGPDAVDFATLFKDENPMNLRFLTALRMNATYPYILPNVWLPSSPVIDVVDAGLRDNYGQETSLRFLHTFKDWIKENTRGVLIIQVRSRQKGGWDNSVVNGDITGILTRPFTMLQNNWFMLQDYFQDDEITYAQNSLDSNFHRVAFMYIPEKEDRGATINFHLTASEKKEVIASLKRKNNVEAFAQVERYLKR